ncbi:holo-ACP synthase [uncultured Paenibacillus sp.]|uniref:holo-ACP synthase n=1 Tax=uncultured Paenibacillus sp. TaxID=227322 RepID=UPI0028D79456|nr:holo-ACP synthase [uncultured Paenibacillus sp.]
MIIGVGHDLVEIERVRKLLAQGTGDRFLQRILTRAEYGRAQLKGGKLAEFTAGRFAAKEAVVKALGCGIGAAVGFADIELLPDGAGKPCCTLSPGSLERLGMRLGMSGEKLTVHVSITHERSIASAFAVAVMEAEAGKPNFK